MTPLVSIITPTYNRDEYLAETIESVLAQTFTDWELIIIDDGSTTEGCRRIASAYCERDPRIRYQFQANRGPSAARNHGIALAGGSYLAFLDSDDRYLPDGLETLVKALQSADDRVRLVYGDFVKYFQAEKRLQPTRVRPPMPRPGLYFQFLVPGGNPVAPSACLLVRSVIDEIGGFDSRFDSLEDRELWSRLVRVHDIAHIGKAVAIYRKHENQITRNRSLWRLANDRQVYEFFSSLPLEAWFPDAADAKAQAKALDKLALLLLKRPDPPLDSALHLLRLAQRKSPDHRRRGFLNNLDSKIPPILREQYGCDTRIATHLI